MRIPLDKTAGLAYDSRYVMSALLAPSILAADFACLGEQVKLCEVAGADMLHVDVMDGRFVPNISFGFVVMEALKRTTTLPLDVHLMLVEPEKFIPEFVAAGASTLMFHLEATHNAYRAVQHIRGLGAKPGVVINPGTPVEMVEPLLEELEQVLLMTVNPGFGGQSFIPQSLGRLRKLKALRDRLNPQCRIEVDGGINLQTAPESIAAGADILVAGSVVFKGDVGQNIRDLRASYAAAG